MRLRGGVYYADFQVNGRRFRRRLSSSLDAARQILNELKARADRAEWGMLNNDYPLEQMKDEYLRHCHQVLKPSTAERYRLCLNTIVPQLGVVRAGQIRQEKVEAYRDDRLTHGDCPRTINMEVGARATMFRWAASPNVAMIAGNPLVGLKPLRHDHPKDGRPLTDFEVGRLLDKSPQPWRDIWYAYLVTGLRKSELAHLLFHDIDLGEPRDHRAEQPGEEPPGAAHSGGRWLVGHSLSAAGHPRRAKPRDRDAARNYGPIARAFQQGLCFRDDTKHALDPPLQSLQSLHALLRSREDRHPHAGRRGPGDRPRGLAQLAAHVCHEPDRERR
jgi:integrase